MWLRKSNELDKCATGTYNKKDEDYDELADYAPVEISGLLYHFLWASDGNYVKVETLWTLSIPHLDYLYFKHLSVLNYFLSPLNISTKYVLIFLPLPQTSLSQTSLYFKQKFRSRYNYSF